MGVVEEYPGYWGGIVTMMAIVTGVIMNVHQKFNSNGNSKSGIWCDKGDTTNSICAINQVID
jgi:hypothetical protein